MPIAVSALSANGGRLLVTVRLERETVLCGLLAELFYDGACLAFVSAELLCEDGNLCYSDLGGRVRLVADGDKNFLRGEIVTLVFEITKDMDLSVELSVEEAYSFDDQGDLVSYSTSSRSVAFWLCNEEKPYISGILPRDDGAFAGFELVGASKKWRIGAGFEIKIFSPQAVLDCYRVVVSPVSEEDGGISFCHRLRVPNDGIAYVLVVPLTYRRVGVERGDGVLFTFNNGKITSETK